MPDFYEVVTPDMYIRRNDSDHFCIMNNGSTVYFINLQSAEGTPKVDYQSMKFAGFWMEQAEELDDDGHFLMLLGRMRQHSEGSNERKCWITCNPAGHNWIWARWVDENRNFEKMDDFVMHEAPMESNPHIPKDYIETLKALYPPAWQRRFVEGAWESFSGLWWPHFKMDVHVKPWFVPPPSWRMETCFDHGIANPTCIVFAAVDQNKNIYIVDEIYETGKLASQISQQYWEILRGRYGRISAYNIADPSMFHRSQISISSNHKRQEPFSIADEYDDCKISLNPANNEFRAGVNRVGEYLVSRPEHRNPFTQEKGSPMLFITENCGHLINELLNYRVKQEHRILSSGIEVVEEKEDRKSPNHACDCLRYLVMDRPLPPLIEKFTQKIEQGTLKLVMVDSWAKGKDVVEDVIAEEHTKNV